MLDLEVIFAKHKDEYIKFNRVENPAHTRPDLCAFLLLHELSPPAKPGRDMVSAAEHDEFFLDADVDTVAANATEEQVVTLIRCGVRFDAQNYCFAMFA